MNYIDVVVNNGGPEPNSMQLRLEVATVTGTPIATGDGAKFEIAVAPAAGYRNGSSTVGFDSGGVASTWTVLSAPSGTLSTPTPTSAAFAASGPYSVFSVARIQAVSTADPSKVAIAPVWFNPGGMRISVLGNSSAALNPGATRALSAKVLGVPVGQSGLVRWSIGTFPANNTPDTGGSFSTGSTCSASTVYTAPTTIQNVSTPVKIRVESCYDTNVFVLVDVELGVTAGVVSIIPSAAGNLAPFATRGFTTAVSGAPDGNVKWNFVSGPSGISSNGSIGSGVTCVSSMTYRAPSTIPAAGNIQLRAESCANSSWSSVINIPVVVSSSVGVSISPKPTSVNGTYTFTATVSNADTTGVAWSVSPSGAGTIHATTGVFTPASGYSGTATVTAKSSENLAVQDTATFNVVLPVSITISSSAPSQSVVPSGTANFTISYSSTGTTGQVSFSMLNLPVGANLNFNPPSVTNQSQASIVASVSPGGISPGTYNMTFQATNGTITKTVPLTLVVLSCGSITVSPSSVNVYPYQMANFTAYRTGTAASYGVTWEKDTVTGSFSSMLNPPAVSDPQISYFAADPTTQPQTVTVTARSAAPGCSAITGSATVTKVAYVPNGLSLLYTNPLGITVKRDQERFFDYGAASQNGAGSVRYIQLELRNNMGEMTAPAIACSVRFEYTTYNNDPTAPTFYAWAAVAPTTVGSGSWSGNTHIAPRGGSASTSEASTTTCELFGLGSEYVRSTNIMALHMKLKLKSPAFPTGTVHAYIYSYGMDPYEPAIRQYMGSFTLQD